MNNHHYCKFIETILAIIKYQHQINSTIVIKEL